MFRIIIWLNSLLSFNGFWYLLSFKDIKGKAFIFTEGSVDNELVLFIRMREVYYLFTFIIYVGRVIIIIFDFLLWRNKFANICS